MRKISSRNIIAGVLIGGTVLFFAAHILIAVIYGGL